LNIFRFKKLHFVIISSSERFLSQSQLSALEIRALAKGFLRMGSHRRIRGLKGEMRFVGLCRENGVKREGWNRKRGAKNSLIISGFKCVNLSLSKENLIDMKKMVLVDLF